MDNLPFRNKSFEVGDLVTLIGDNSKLGLVTKVQECTWNLMINVYWQTPIPLEGQEAFEGSWPSFMLKRIT